MLYSDYLLCRGTEGVLCQVWRDCGGDGHEGSNNQAVQVSIVTLQ